MDDEFDYFTLRHLLAAIIAIALGWGLLWSASNGARVAIENLKSTKDFIASVVFWNDSSPSPAPQSTDRPISSITVMIGGDLMMDRKIRQLGEESGYESLFAGIAPLFRRADIVAVNLEGPITSNASKTLLPDKTTSKELIFTFHPDTARALAYSGIDLVSLANNHTDNFGIAGLRETKTWLAESGVTWFGSPSNSSSTEFIMDMDGVKVAFVGYHAFQSGFDRIIADIARISADGTFVIVMPHWGDEYATTSSRMQQSMAKAFIDAGADAVIGAHPHVVQEQAWISGVPVFYSLGNLLFDQYFSPEVMKGNVVEMRIAKLENGEMSLDELKVYETSTAGRDGVRLVGRAD